MNLPQFTCFTSLTSLMSWVVFQVTQGFDIRSGVIWCVHLISVGPVPINSVSVFGPPLFLRGNFWLFSAQCAMIFTSCLLSSVNAAQGGYVLTRVCVLVGRIARKTTERISAKLGWRVGPSQEYIPLTFGKDVDECKQGFSFTSLNIGRQGEMVIQWSISMSNTC